MKPLLHWKKKNGLWSPFPRTARPKALALAITLFQIMVAVLPSSGFGSSPWAGLETPGLKAHGTTMWTQFVNARECYLTFSFCTNGDFLSSSMQFLHFAILYCCHKACALHKSGTEPTMSWSRWGWRCDWMGCTWPWSPCCLGHCRDLVLSVQNNLESLLVLHNT